MTDPLVVGRYFMADVIGGGGMARVHVGRILGAAGFSRVVAIKRLHRASLADREFATMLADEARLASRIRHPNVVPVLDVVRLGDELLLVMEYVHGASLDHLLTVLARRRERVPRAIAARIALDVLAGLQAAHDAKGERGEPLELVHRDVSPHNVVVGVDGAARLIDFGIAKAARKLSTTQAGQIKGKLSYMAPEQLRAQPLDRRTDLYAAGLVLWEVAVGRRAVTPSSENLGHAVRQALETKVPPPSTLVEISPALDAVIRKALELDPANRFPNADAMAAALEAAGDVAKPKTVSAWVETVAAELLESRRSMVERVEQLSGSDVAPDVTGGAMPAAGASAPSALTGRASLDAEEATARMPPPELPPSLVAAPAPPPAPPPDAFAPELAPAGVPRRSLVGAIAGGVITLLFLAVGAVFLVRSRPTAAPNPSPTPTTSESVVASPIPPPAVTLGDTSPPAEGPPPVTSAGPSARRGPRPRAAAPSASTRAVPDCSQPFSVDANGTRIPRRECL